MAMTIRLPFPHWRLPLMLFLISFALLTAVGPALAHKDHRSANASSDTAASASVDNPADAPMAMAWPTDTGMAMTHEQPKAFGPRLVSWLGAWHTAVIHFPIALLLTAALLEAAAASRKTPVYSAGNKLLLGLATIGGFAAAALGWANAGLPGGTEGTTLSLHRWIGTLIPFVYLLLWRLKRPAETAADKSGPPVYGIVLSVAVIIILLQAYLGGEVTHGAGHMMF